MIQLFRKFRKSLLSGNNISRYVLYAIGEILLVVISILIALHLPAREATAEQAGVNNWNEKRNDLKDSREFHQRLLDDLNTTTDFLEDITTFSDQVESGISKAVEILQRKTVTKQEKEILDNALTNFFRLSRHLPGLTSYDEMKSTGQLGLIYNKELRQQIGDYLVFRDLVSTVYEDLNEKVNETAFIDPYVKFTKDNTFEDNSVEYNFRELASDQTVINTLSRYAFHWKTKISFSNNLKVQAMKLKSAVEQELDRLKS